MRLSVGADNILLDLLDESLWDQTVSNDMTVSSYGSFHSRSSSTAKTMEFTEWIRVVRATSLIKKDALQDMTREGSGGSSRPVRRPSYLSIPSKFSDPDPAMANLSSSQGSDKAKRPDSPAVAGVPSKPSISRLFNKARKPSVENMGVDAHRDSPTPSTPHMLTSPTQPLFPSTSNALDVQPGFPPKSKSRGILSKANNVKARLSPSLYHPSLPDEEMSDPMTSAAAGSEPPDSSVVPSGTEILLADVSSDAVAPDLSRVNVSSSSSRLFPSLLGKSNRQPSSGSLRRGPPSSSVGGWVGDATRAGFGSARTQGALRQAQIDTAEPSSEGVRMKRSMTVGSHGVGMALAGRVKRRPRPNAERSPALGSMALKKNEDADTDPVPLLLRKCVELIEEIGLQTEGLYRVSGSALAQDRLKRLLVSDARNVNLLPPSSSALAESVLPTSREGHPFRHVTGRRSPRMLGGDATRDDVRMRKKDHAYSSSSASALYDDDIHVVSGVVKSYLRDGLPPTMEPVCTLGFYSAFLTAAGLQDWDGKMVAIHDTLHKLPAKNFATLKFICNHLRKVASHERENRMSVKNLSIIFAPNLIRPPPAIDSVQQVLRDMPLQCALVEYLIEYADWFFKDENESDSDADGDSISSSEKRPAVEDTRTEPEPQTQLPEEAPLNPRRSEDDKPFESVADMAAKLRLTDLKIVSAVSPSPSDKARSLRTSRSDTSLNSEDRRRQLRLSRRRAQVISFAPEADDDRYARMRSSESESDREISLPQRTQESEGVSTLDQSTPQDMESGPLPAPSVQVTRPSFGQSAVLPIQTSSTLLHAPALFASPRTAATDSATIGPVSSPFGVGLLPPSPLIVVPASDKRSFASRSSAANSPRSAGSSAPRVEHPLPPLPPPGEDGDDASAEAEASAAPAAEPSASKQSMPRSFSLGKVLRSSSSRTSLPDALAHFTGAGATAAAAVVISAPPTPAKDARKRGSGKGTTQGTPSPAGSPRPSPPTMSRSASPAAVRAAMPLPAPPGAALDAVLSGGSGGAGAGDTRPRTPLLVRRASPLPRRASPSRTASVRQTAARPASALPPARSRTPDASTGVADLTLPQVQLRVDLGLAEEFSRWSRGSGSEFA
ncbi:hypothetical protein HK405_006005 [Cladochytrium tenue]|nr:hypothetical protein HK405_006005 [Cladochytrium tenue]